MIVDGYSGWTDHGFGSTATGGRELNLKIHKIGDTKFSSRYQNQGGAQARRRAYNGKVRNNNGDITYGNTFAINDIIGVYIDLDNSKLYFAKNGTVQNSGTGISITAVASTPLGVYLPAISWNDGSTTGTCSLNFGSPEFSISSGNTDANGYGNFEYDPSSGTFDSASKSFYAINTKNLAEFG